MAQTILEGTHRELVPFLEDHPNERYRLTELSSNCTNLALQEQYVDLDYSPEKRCAAIAMLRSWIDQGNAADDEIKRLADIEGNDFMAALRANRIAAGEVVSDI